MEQYYLEHNTFIIKNYDKKPPFTSFLPGLAGVKGIPLWAFYVNRGQGVCSFGFHHKNNAIMEFYPANTAYENTAVKGFRTFVKANSRYFEPFFPYPSVNVQRNMYINQNSFSIEEINLDFCIKTTVKYFMIPNEDYGALVRRVIIKNISQNNMELELLDGIARIIPYGIKNDEFKEMSNLLSSWTDIKNIENNIPFYTTRSSTDDKAQVEMVEGGYFLLSFRNGGVIKPIYDPYTVFGQDTSLIFPLNFYNNSLKDLLLQPQYFENKIPCGFSPLSAALQPDEEAEINTIIGFTEKIEEINGRTADICSREYISRKEKETEKLTEDMTGDVDTTTAFHIFDRYIRQCYLDNFLRGGYPFIFNGAGNKSVVHLFSRKHGDPERDYNFFSTMGEFYSQGNGNFRDVCQNRRNDVFFNPDVDDFNIRTFFGLIQADGYNPLEVRPSIFTIMPDKQIEVKELLDGLDDERRKKLKKLLCSAFTPGQLAKIKLSDSMLEEILNLSMQNIEAVYKEGYWSDHWTYLMDLTDSYLKIYPERKEKMLFHTANYRFFDSPARVLPRDKKYILCNGQVRQYNAVALDEEKLGRGWTLDMSNWLKTADGSIYYTNLYVKMLSLALNKFSCLDPEGMGIEMEAGKPGWNDAMNGLPGLVGSGLCETFELKRLINFMIDVGKYYTNATIKIPVEIDGLMNALYSILKEFEKGEINQSQYYEREASERESYRNRVRFCLSGQEISHTVKEINVILQFMEKKINEGIQKAMTFGQGLPPTYFIFSAIDYNQVEEINGLTFVRVHKFQAKALPYFLESSVRMLKLTNNHEIALSLYNKVKASLLYDKKLKMYKISEPIDKLTIEVGRIKAFTPGWLERESIFLHMEYKYLLSMLHAGLYDEFFKEIKNVFVPFINPEVYGRSTLENCSFIVSSENPNLLMHGRGFVSRLSGSTSEAISMWIEMFAGRDIFTMKSGMLCLRFHPILPGWFFDENGEARFMFLSKCKVVYHNPLHLSTFGENRAVVQNIIVDGNKGWNITGNEITGDTAKAVRNGEIKSLDIFLG